MTVSSIKAESCYLQWDAPLDDGGSELTNYIVEKKEVVEKEPELEEGQQSPLEPQWVEVTNIIIERKYGVSLLPMAAPRMKTRHFRDFIVPSPCPPPAGMEPGNQQNIHVPCKS